MKGEIKHLYVFGPFRFDPEEHLLLRDGEPVPLAPKVVETLSVLVQNAGHLVEKDDLMKRIWPDAFVEEGNLNKNIFLLRKTLGQCDGGREYIETVPKLGYRFVATVVPVSEALPMPHAKQPERLTEVVIDASLGSDAPFKRFRRLQIAIAMAVLVLAAAAIWWASFSRETPRILRITQITRDNLTKAGPL